MEEKKKDGRNQKWLRPDFSAVVKRVVPIRSLLGRGRRSFFVATTVANEEEEEELAKLLRAGEVGNSTSPYSPRKAELEEESQRRV